MSLLTATVVKNIGIYAGIYFIFLKKRPRPNLKGFQYQIWTSVKRSKSRYQVRQILALFCKLVALTLLKALDLPKLSNKSSLRWHGVNSKQKNVFSDKHEQNN